jgi:N-acetylmuramoyl-L-alanine amidase
MGLARKGASGLWLAWALMAATLAPNCAPAFAGDPAAVAKPSGVLGVRLGSDQSQARIVIDLDRAVSAKVLAVESGGGRIVIALPHVNLPRNLEGGGKGLVRAWRVQPDASGAKLTVEVSGVGEVRRRFLLPPSDGVAHYRYVIDLVGNAVAPVPAMAQGAEAAATPIGASLSRTRRSGKGLLFDLAATNEQSPDQTGPGIATRPAPIDLPRSVAPPTLDPPIPVPNVALSRGSTLASTPPPTADAAPELRSDRSRSKTRTRLARNAAPRRIMKVVVIDAGHGGHDPGAQSGLNGGVYNEKDITLATALALRSRLERTGRYKVVMTRETDVFIPLETRVQIARKAKADLFIALHADSAGSNPDAHGASVYTLSDTGGTRVHTVLTDNEWFNHRGDKADPKVSQILLDLTQRDTRNRSAVFAGLLIDRISDRVDLLPRSHRDAGYFVLLAPDVPAVLLEMGFITSPLDQRRLTDRAQQGRLADAISEAIDTYFTGQTRLATS